MHHFCCILCIPQLSDDNVFLNVDVRNDKNSASTESFIICTLSLQIQEIAKSVGIFDCRPPEQQLGKTPVFLLLLMVITSLLLSRNFALLESRNLAVKTFICRTALNLQSILSDLSPPLIV